VKNLEKHYFCHSDVSNDFRVWISIATVPAASRMSLQLNYLHAARKQIAPKMSCFTISIKATTVKVA